MRVISMGRSSDKHFGNIDDLDPKKYHSVYMYRISLGRGNNDDFGNIDDLDPKKYDWNQMLYIMKGRGTDQEYQNLDKLDPYVHKYFDDLNKDILYKENTEYLI